MLTAGSLWELVVARVDETPDAPVAVDEEMRTLTFAELAVEAERVAAGLAVHGLGVGSVVVWQLPAWIESLVLVAALARLAAVQVPMVPAVGERALGAVAADVGADLLVVPARWDGFDRESGATEIARGLGGCGVLVADRALPQGDPTTLEPFDRGTEDGVRWVAVAPDGAAAGHVRGAGHVRAAGHVDAGLLAMGRGLSLRLELSPHDRVAPVGGVGSLRDMAWLVAALQTGCSLVLTEEFSARETPEVLSREGVTVAGVSSLSGTLGGESPLGAYLAAQRDSLVPIFPDLRAFVGGGGGGGDGYGGGDGHDSRLADEARTAFDAPVLPCFGVAEAPLLTMGATTDADEELVVGSGKPLPGVELKLVRPDGQVAIDGEDGEIRARAPQVMRGQVGAPVDHGSFDEEGFVDTGHVGRIDPKGNLIVLGRS